MQYINLICNIPERKIIVIAKMGERLAYGNTTNPVILKFCVIRRDNLLFRLINARVCLLLFN